MLEGCENLSVESGSGVLTLTLRRPAKLNAIDSDMRQVLQQSFETFLSNADLRVLLVRAEGRYFSAGMDISQMGDRPQSGIELRREYRQLHDMFDLLERVEKPVVFAIQGPCLGGALEMALSADFRVASTDAAFGLPEINLGVIPGSGGTSRLTRMVGPAWARWLVMAGQKVDAAVAREMGLVQAVYPADCFNDEVAKLVSQLAALPREVLGLAKAAIDLSSATDPTAARQVERIANTILMQGDEHRQAVQKFRDRGKSRP